jgi:soluble lytic murein transglycosylase-like protein
MAKWRAGWWGGGLFALLLSFAAPAHAMVLEVGDDGMLRQRANQPEVVWQPVQAAPAPRAASVAKARPRAIPAPEVAAKLEAAATAYGLSPALVKSVAWQESRFRQHAVSTAGARGVMQLMPATARELGVDPDDTRQNIQGGAAYLRQMLDRFDGDLTKALAAYNAGPGRVERHRGVPPIKETQGYVAAIMARLAEQSLEPR